ncbi:MAG: MmgE/PrpD family protein [Betaproteobacteria bacterium]|nr:MmgE/PrpD family protein [Betaproteobacteria bacterium]
MDQKTYAHRLAARFAALSFNDIKPGSRLAIKRLLMDYLGVALAGSRSASGHIARRFAREHGGKAQARLIGDGARVPMTSAAFANAISSHSIELDDIDVLALFHFSPPVFSAGLAVADHAGASGRQLITALAAGCEMMERASRATNPSLRNRGYHTTPTCGVFGATVAAAKLLRLSADKMVSALGLAGAQASGLMEMYGPSMQKRFNPGPTARNGVTSALMARLGFTGADTIFEGERGFLRAFSDETHPEALAEGIGRPYELLIEFKPYSCARPIHNAIDCALDVRGQPGFDADAIERIHVARHPDWARYHQNRAPRTYHEAQVSLPFSTAVAFLEGQVLLKQYSDRNIRNPRVRQLCKITTISEDASLPRGVSCRMTVTLRGGRQLASQVDYPKGSIRNPMSEAELQGKFESLAGPVIGIKRARALAAAVMNIERVADVSSVLRMTAVR